MNQPAAKRTPPVKQLPPDVLDILREQAKSKTQIEMADELGISASYVNKAIHDKYQGDIEKLCARVRGLWAGSTVECPVLGAINTKVCQDQQGHPACWSNPMRAALTRSCRKCPHAQHNKPASAEAITEGA